MIKKIDLIPLDGILLYRHSYAHGDTFLFLNSKYNQNELKIIDDKFFEFVQNNIVFNNSYWAFIDKKNTFIQVKSRKEAFLLIGNFLALC